MCVMNELSYQIDFTSKNKVAIRESDSSQYYHNDDGMFVPVRMIVPITNVFERNYHRTLIIVIANLYRHL